MNVRIRGSNDWKERRVSEKAMRTEQRHTSATPDYNMGYDEEVMMYLGRRNVRTHSAYLLPYLSSGLRILDAGCGPGAISVGLAEAVAPGEMHGVDMEESQVELARSLARTAGYTNAIFHVGDVTALPFDDDFFDIAHCHSLLMHVPDTHAVLSELKRVLKPGGLLACREIIYDSSFIHPNSTYLRRSWELFADLLESDDGHPQMGREMKTHILDAGFTNVRMNASFDFFNEPDEIEFAYNYVTTRLLSPNIVDAGIKYGAATPEMFHRVISAFGEWRHFPHASIAVAFGEALAIKP